VRTAEQFIAGEMRLVHFSFPFCQQAMAMVTFSKEEHADIHYIYGHSDVNM
jgi:hypothetical protein